MADVSNLKKRLASSDSFQHTDCIFCLVCVFWDAMNSALFEPVLNDYLELLMLSWELKLTYSV